MSRLRPLRPVDAMRYTDGELSPREARRMVAAHARELGDSNAAIVQVGDFVRAHASRCSDGFTVVDAVIGRVRDDPTTASRGRRAAARGGIWTVAGAGLAVAAAVVLLVVTHRAPDGRAVGRASTAEAKDVAQATSVGHGAPDVELSGASIEALDIGARGATLFVVEAGSVATPVVWLDDGDELRDRMGPL